MSMRSRSNVRVCACLKSDPEELLSGNVQRSQEEEIRLNYSLFVSGMDGWADGGERVGGATG